MVHYRPLFRVPRSLCSSYTPAPVHFSLLSNLLAQNVFCDARHGDTESRTRLAAFSPARFDRALTIGPVNAEVLVYRGNSARKGIKGAVSESLTRANLRFNKIIAVGDRRKNVLKQVSGIAGVGAVSISTFASLASTCPVYFLISGPSACPLKRHISPA